MNRENWQILGFLMKFLTKSAFFDERIMIFWWQNPLKSSYEQKGREVGSTSYPVVNLNQWRESLALAKGRIMWPWPWDQVLGLGLMAKLCGLGLGQKVKLCGPGLDTKRPSPWPWSPKALFLYFATISLSCKAYTDCQTDFPVKVYF